MQCYVLFTPSLVQWSAAENVYPGKGVTLKWKYATALGYNTYRIVYSLLFKPLPYFLKVDKPVQW
jgi:hypothetical protein